MPNSPGATNRGGWRQRSAERLRPSSPAGDGGVRRGPNLTDRTARLALIAGATKDPVMPLNPPPLVTALLEHESLDGDRLATLLPERQADWASA